MLLVGFELTKHGSCVIFVKQIEIKAKRTLIEHNILTQPLNAVQARVGTVVEQIYDLWQDLYHFSREDRGITRHGFDQRHL